MQAEIREEKTARRPGAQDFFLPDRRSRFLIAWRPEPTFVKKRRKIHRVTLFERYLHLHRISLCFSTLHHPAASTEKCPECLHGSTYPYARHRPAVFCFRFFKSCRDKKNRPDVFSFRRDDFKCFLRGKRRISPTDSRPGRHHFHRLRDSHFHRPRSRLGLWLQQ
mgnify:CR=1 FL=1